jgi:hypothetical protein
MEDINHILNILKIRPDYLSKDEMNALLIYSVNQSTLLNLSRNYFDNIKIERLIDTLAFIMETKVYKNNDERNIQLCNYENDIRAMGWTDDYIDETIKLWSEFNDDGHSMWGHRMISDWGKNWLTSNMDEYIYSNVQHDFESKGDNVY